MSYHSFLASKRIVVKPSGFEPEHEIHQVLFDFQKDIVRWALKKGKAAVFAGTGLGKTLIQLEWANHVYEVYKGNILILAPLAVAEQTVREGLKLGLTVHLCRTQNDVKNGINITNYEMLSHFDTDSFAGIVLDESSILKSFEGKVRTEMLSTFFVHDGGDTAKWRLKKHAVKAFWEWVSSWAVMLHHPSDLGYDGHKFDLPELRLHEIVVDKSGYVVRLAETLQDRRAARRDSIHDRVSCAAEIANQNNDNCLIWCDLNSESEMLTKAINGAIEVKGSHDPEYKTKAMLNFAEGNIKTLVSKPSICGFGLNFQKCHKMIFVGLSDSFEQYYQAVRRCWRFGQDKPVDVYIITSEKEGAVVKNIKRKEKEFENMLSGMISATQELTKENLKQTERTVEDYKTEIAQGESWTMYKGDCVEETKNLKNDSIHYIIFSPPFASLYTYSNSERDMGNSKTKEEFEEHFNFLAAELHRVLMPGRLMSVHCMNFPSMKERDGVIGLKDFRGDIIRIFQKVGLIYHSEVCIWKDPVTAMQRTKALGLLHKQLKKDSCMSRMGIPDYVVTFRKLGNNPERVTHTNESFPVGVWQRYASPIWSDINPSDTLQKESARENEDERHIAPLQLEVIRRCLELWTNPNDIVFSPFAGIGSEGYESVKIGRRFIGIELKDSYYKQACKNLEIAQKSLLKPKQTQLVYEE